MRNLKILTGFCCLWIILGANLVFLSTAKNISQKSGKVEEEKLSPSPVILNFEDFLGKVEGYGSKLKTQGPLTIENVRFIPPAQTPTVFNFAGGFSNHPDYGLNQSFETDYIGIFAYYEGIKIIFPSLVKKVEFDTIYCACATQPSFSVIAGDKELTTFTTPGKPLATKRVSVTFSKEVKKVTIKFIHGSNGLLTIDNLSYLPK
ncbi:MAG: hypothetical protein PVH61_29885 [Candidatus Aminicenantes bacterium]|jgi:hypothetical protein